MTTVTTQRVTAAITAATTKRVGPDADELIQDFDCWDGSWEDSWEDCWLVTLTLTQIGGTQRVAASPAAAATKRVTL